MNRYDKLTQAASRLIGFESEIANYDLHKTIHLKERELQSYHRAVASFESMRLKHTNSINEASMNKDQRQSSETEVDSYQRENSIEEEELSSPLSSPAGGGSKNRVLADTTFTDNLPMVLSRHRLGLLKNEVSTTDTSHLLREILQNKEKQLHDQLASNINGLNGSNVIQDTSGLISKLLKNNAKQQHKSLSTEEKGSSQSAEESAEDSDVDSTIERMMNEDEIDVGDKHMSKSLCSISQLVDSKEAKRARVENIITSMRHSPSHITCDSQSTQEARRQKRKQYQPQQHELIFEHSEPKSRKVERDDLRKQLQQLQEQLNSVQRRYSELYDVSNSEQSASGDDEECCSRRARKQSAAAPPEKAEIKKLNGEVNGSGKLSFDSLDIDPSHLINQASRLVKEQEIVAKQTSSPVPLQSGELQGLATSLKSEITQVVGNAVDTIVSRWLENHSYKSRSGKMSPQSHVHRQEQAAVPKERIKSPASNQDYPMDYYAMPRVHDKQTVSEATPCRNSPPDLPRAHNHQISYPHPHPIPTYFTSPSQVITSPLYNSEPEQTEALSLVVNTPKKKRTKVTDTRLSPRAARALLQEAIPAANSSVSSQHELEKHGRTCTSAAYHPHIMPPMLPTSVAIPNPSLQHPDILGYYRDQNYGEGTQSSGHSPLNNDQTSPVSDNLMLLKNDGYDGTCESSYDANNHMLMISF